MPTEPSTTRKPVTQPLTPPPELLAREQRPRTPLPGWWRWALLAAVLVLAGGVALLLLRSNDPRADTRPIEVVKGFAAALAAKDADAMLGYVEPTVFRREISPEVRAYVEYLEAVRFDNPRYELLDNDGERAHVRWTATMQYTLNLGDTRKSGERTIDTTFELTKFEGTWYLRNAKLPDA
ncbi:MAG: hypothetical protein U0Z44_04930 [Kouleothrix sp.]|jgi:hypothetical protein|nr:hypothetical protein [Kouleothrix sp.]